MTTALVLAGGPADEVAALAAGAPNKAFVPIAGVTLVERTLRALRGANGIDRIVVVAPESAHGHPALALADDVRPDGIKIRDSLRRGLEGLPAEELVLISTSDLPVLTPRSVDDFLERAAAIDPDVGYGCLERAVHRAAYPQVPHTWAPLRGGTYCGTGLMVLRPAVYARLDRFIEQLGHARKNPLALARLFGASVLLRFAVRQLTIAQAESRASEILGAKVRAIVSPYAETAVNVDRMSDVALAETLIHSEV